MTISSRRRTLAYLNNARCERSQWLSIVFSESSPLAPSPSIPLRHQTSNLVVLLTPSQRRLNLGVQESQTVIMCQLTVTRYLIIRCGGRSPSLSARSAHREGHIYWYVRNLRQQAPCAAFLGVWPERGWGRVVHRSPQEFKPALFMRSVRVWAAGTRQRPSRGRCLAE